MRFAASGYLRHTGYFDRPATGGIALLAVLMITSSLCCGQSRNAATRDRWSIQSDSGIVWRVDGSLPHADHIEMSGEKVSMWVEYEIESDKTSVVRRTVVFPTFRMKPNNTHASLMYSFGDESLPRMFVDGHPLRACIVNGRKLAAASQRTDSIRHDGIMTIYSTIGDPPVIRCERHLFPSADSPMALEVFVFKNISSRNVSFAMDGMQDEITIDSARTTRGPHRVIVRTTGEGSYTIPPEGSVRVAVSYCAAPPHAAVADIDPGREKRGRSDRLRSILGRLQLETPDTVLNTAFRFAKIRATESIYKTKGGYMHSPGGLAYYAAVWANDQAEYVNPFFAMLGDDVANRSAMNSYRLFARYMNSAYRPIPSSIIAEGDGYWNGAGDRGDMAMIAYGASRYALTYGSLDSARVLWPLITWCLEYCKRHVNDAGVVTSDSDELEGRFPAGKANLATSSLYYDALISASMLAKSLGEQPVVRRLQSEARILKGNIERYFGRTVEGFKTYQYFEGNDVLRSWICLPLCMGIYDRKEGTINALFSPRLWTKDGLATQAGDKTFWDRSTLYALRGVLQAGETTRAMEFIRYYSRRRLLGEHVPYPVEAFPEGNQRHLAAESGLCCRVFTEGLFGIRPSGLDEFVCTPHLPKDWDRMALRKIHVAGEEVDLEVSRLGKGKLQVIARSGKARQFVIHEGESLTIHM